MPGKEDTLKERRFARRFVFTLALILGLLLDGLAALPGPASLGRVARAQSSADQVYLDSGESSVSELWFASVSPSLIVSIEVRHRSGGDLGGYRVYARARSGAGIPNGCQFRLRICDGHCVWGEQQSDDLSQMTFYASGAWSEWADGLIPSATDMVQVAVNPRESCSSDPGTMYVEVRLESTSEVVEPPSIDFWADHDSIPYGACTTLHWRVENVQAVYYEGQGVTGSGDRQECPRQTTTYELRVVHRDGSEETRTVTVYVEATPTPSRTTTATPTPTPSRTTTATPTSTPRTPTPTPRTPTPTPRTPTPIPRTPTPAPRPATDTPRPRITPKLQVVAPTPPPMLVVTHSGALDARLGNNAWANQIVPELNWRYPNWVELDLADRYATPPAAEVVHAEIRAVAGQRGRPQRIFIVGGHEVVPLGWKPNLYYQSSDVETSLVMGEWLASQPLPNQTDWQHSFVYSDDPYADFDDDWRLDVPIARLPDGKDLAMVLNHLRAVYGYVPGAFAIRFPNRPSHLIGQRYNWQIYSSPPYGYFSNGTQWPLFTPPGGGSQYGLFMLHGNPQNWVWTGQDGEVYNAALTANEAANVNVVFSEACYGAYIAPHWERQCATWGPPGTGCAQWQCATWDPSGTVCQQWQWNQIEKDTNNSIALHFLDNGAHAFIGSTDIGYTIVRKKCTRKFLGICLKKQYNWEGDLGYTSTLLASYFFEEVNKFNVHPFDAYFRAKQRYGWEIPDVLVGPSSEESTRFQGQWKTLVEFIYYGAPPPYGP